jgi:hypothetical protein
MNEEELAVRHDDDVLSLAVSVWSFQALSGEKAVNSAKGCSIDGTYLFVDGTDFGNDPVNPIRHLLRRLSRVLLARGTAIATEYISWS